MKNIFLLLAILCLIAIPIYSQEDTTAVDISTAAVEDSTAEEEILETVVDPVFAAIALGDACKESWDHAGAAEAYLQALELDSTSYEAAWKAGREVTEVANKLPKDMKDEKEAKFAKAVALCEHAIALNPDGWEGHFEQSVALGRLALFRGKKEKIKLSKRIKEEVDKAIELNPEADLAYHVLGRWHQNIANLSGFEKFFANTFLGDLPPATNEESASAFLRAVEIDPAHIEHHLELARTYKYMGEKELARQYLQNVLDLPAIDEDDAEFKKEAEELLEKLD